MLRLGATQVWGYYTRGQDRIEIERPNAIERVTAKIECPKPIIAFSKPAIPMDEIDPHSNLTGRSSAHIHTRIAP
jgi:hypothetical protein